MNRNKLASKIDMNILILKYQKEIIRKKYVGIQISLLDKEALRQQNSADTGKKIIR